jgi:hypothetical protein
VPNDDRTPQVELIQEQSAQPPVHVTLQGMRAHSVELYDACVRAVEVNNLVMQFFETKQDINKGPELWLKVHIAQTFLRQAIARAEVAL